MDGGLEREDPIDLASRPYLAGLVTESPSTRPGTPSTGLAHLFADASGRAPTPSGPIVIEQSVASASSSVPIVDIRPPVHESAPPTIRASRSGTVDRAGDESLVDWDLVAQLAKALELRDGRVRSGFDVASSSAEPETAAEIDGRTQIEGLIDRQVTSLVLAHGEAADWTPARRQAHVQAVFDAAFRYGRLSALLREDVENIDVLGHESVWVTLPDGRRQQRPPIASSDDDLEQLIAEIAADRGRPFARPHGTVRLDIGGARFTALGGPQITPKPRLAIRKHRLVDIDLADLVRAGALSSEMAEFLTASMRAYGSHLISGYAGAGKSTLLRAMTSAFPPEEPIVTIETERELYLDKLPSRHWIVDPLQYLPDATRGDDRDAVFPLDTAIEYALRLNAQVIVFGEILGPMEAASAIKALQAGKGASSTIHAQSAIDAIQRFATALTQAGRLSDDAVPQQQILQTLDFVVQIELVPATASMPQRRVVTEIAEVIPGDAPAGRLQRPITRSLYRWDPDTHRHERGERLSRSRLDRLVRAGLDPDLFGRETP